MLWNENSFNSANFFLYLLIVSECRRFGSQEVVTLLIALPNLTCREPDSELWHR